MTLDYRNGRLVALDPTIRTAKGTPIRRYGPTGVGKLVGSRLYLHENYAYEAFARIRAMDDAIGTLLAASLTHRTYGYPQFGFRCLRFDLKTGAVRFDEAPDFDTAREPRVGKWLLATPDGRFSRGHSDAIWHHKWLFVRPDYKGFDVQASMEWSRTYLAKLRQPPKGGSLRSWLEQLKEVGLA